MHMGIAMDWLFFLLDTLIFLLIVGLLVILASAAGLILVKFLGGRRPLLRYGFPLVLGLVAFVLGSRLAYAFVLASIPSGRWLNLLLAIFLTPLLAPIILEILRFARRELRR
jgi:hypothetical protein